MGKCQTLGSAGVVIRAKAPVLQSGGFLPDPLFVVTPYSRELSWLFVELRNIARELDEFGSWKLEFFSRLAVRAKSVPETASVEDLLFATLLEAYELLGIIEIGMTMHDWTTVIVHPRTVGEDIEPFDRDALKAFFEARGIAIS